MLNNIMELIKKRNPTVEKEVQADLGIDSILRKPQARNSETQTSRFVDMTKITNKPIAT